MPNTKTIGEITEAVVLAEFIQAGFPVSLPFGENQRYDMILDAAGRLLRVQCKTARKLDCGVISFNAHSTPLARTGYRNQADLFAVYAPSTRQVYVLPVDDVPETEVWLRLVPTKNNQKLHVRWAKDHTLEAWAARIKSQSKSHTGQLSAVQDNKAG